MSAPFSSGISFSVDNTGLAYQSGIFAVRRNTALPALGLSFFITITSPSVSVQDAEVLCPPNISTVASYSQARNIIVGRPVSRAEALALCHKIAEDAERRRIETARREYEHDIEAYRDL